MSDPRGYNNKCIYALRSWSIRYQQTVKENPAEGATQGRFQEGKGGRRPPVKFLPPVAPKKFKIRPSLAKIFC